MKIGYKNEIKQLNGLNFIENAYNFSTSGQEQSEAEEAEYICFHCCYECEFVNEWDTTITKEP